MRYDWDRIEHEYVSGKSTMEALAKKYKIPLNTFYKRAEVRKFSEKRESYTKKVREKALARAQARDSRILANLGGALDEAARRLKKYLADDDTLHGKIVTGLTGVVEVRTKKADTKALRDLTAAVKDAAAAMRLLAPDQGGSEAEGAGVVVLPEVLDE